MLPWLLLNAPAPNTNWKHIKGPSHRRQMQLFRLHISGKRNWTVKTERNIGHTEWLCIGKYPTWFPTNKRLWIYTTIWLLVLYNVNQDQHPDALHNPWHVAHCQVKGRRSGHQGNMWRHTASPDWLWKLQFYSKEEESMWKLDCKGYLCNILCVCVFVCMISDLLYVVTYTC